MRDPTKDVFEERDALRAENAKLHTDIDECKKWMSIDQDRLEKRDDEVMQLRQAMHDIYEIYAGSEGLIPLTDQEKYLQRLFKEMAYIAGKHKRAGGGNE